ncbi:MAG: hypothetical protein M9958_01440 [Chitinophagales bacterium]|nr:hypothetical protein [Chitinophagales bacterium]
MDIEYIRWYDYVLFIIYAILLYFISIRIFKKTFIYNFKKYFDWFYFLKVIAAFLYVHIYIYYYGYGDTLRFFRFGQYYKGLLYEVQNLTFWDWIFLPNDTFKNLMSYRIDYAYGFAESSFLINKFSGYLSFFSFNTFLVNTLLFSFFSLIGLWYMFVGLYEMYPKLKKEVAVAILFVPSVVFWGSGLMKDTICIGALGIMTYNVCRIFFLKGKRNIWVILRHFAIFSICAYVISSIKIYQLLAFLPGVFIWIFYSYRDNIRSNFIRKSITPIIIILILISISFGLQLFTENLENYAIESVMDTALGMSYNLSHLDAGSTYNLGPIDPSIFGLIKKIPAAVNVSLFRPYLWEVNNPIMLLSAFESLIVFLISIVVLFRVGVFKVPNKILGSGILLFCFIFSLIFGFATGISSQNFGSLVRYKIPIMPLYLIGIFILYYNAKGQSFFDSIWNRKS